MIFCHVNGFKALYMNSIKKLTGVIACQFTHRIHKICLFSKH